MIIIFVLLIGGIVAWGFMTDWTFSGLLPREGAKCTPEKDEKDENATEYVYDEDEECTVVNKCKTDWEPNTSNTACEYSKSATECTPTGTAITNGKYTFDDAGACELTGCKNDFKLVSGECDDCIDGYTKDGEVCRSCTASDVTAVTGGSSFDVIGQSYTTEDGKCVPNRIAYAGNNGAASCYAYCAGKQEGPWQGSDSMPSEWKGAKCVGVTKGTDYKTLNDTTKCETVRGGNGGNENLCICERSDFFYKQDTFEMPSDLTNEDGDAAMSKGWWQGTPGFELYAGTEEDCEEQAKALGVPAYGIRINDNARTDGMKNTCWAYPKDWTGAAVAENTKVDHYTVCTDPNKKVKDSCA